MKSKLIHFILFVSLCMNVFACADKEDSPPSAQGPAAILGYTLPTGKAIYIPLDLRNNDFTKSESLWSYYRMAYSDNFIVFWEKGFGSDPATAAEQAMRVDIKDLLQKAELFYDVNVNKLQFADEKKSNIGKYRMMIFLKYQSEWLATGSGYDDVIGALWVNPSTCQPVGSVIAHEVGHSFQYQTYCDTPASTCGWRYGFGVNSEGGNCWWEQCAQWQAYKIYPEEQFTNYNYAGYLENGHKHLLHEEPRYSNYFIQDYWCMKHGIEFIGKLWRESKKPEDPIETYQRLTGINQKIFNDEIFDAARHFVFWDIDGIREAGKSYGGRPQCKLTALEGNYYSIDSLQCIENYGYNAIALNVPAKSAMVSASFVGMVGASGYRSKNVDKAGWRYGFVAYLKDGSCAYSDVFSEKEGTATFSCPADCEKLYFVVTGAPVTHWHHAWDDNDTNDEQWPYKVKFNGTNVYGQIAIDPDATPEAVTFFYQVEVPFSATEYTQAAAEINLQQLCQAVTLTPEQIRDHWGEEVLFAGINSDGTLTFTSTANDPGHWFDVNGNVCSWGDTAKIYSELNKDTFVFTIGQYPGHCKVGEKYKMKQILDYEYEKGKKVQVTFVFNVTVK